MGGPVEVAGDQLRAIVERIEHIEEEIRELNEAKKEIFQEAKSNGFDIKVLREIVRLRKQDQKEREEHESLLEVLSESDQGSSRLQGRLILPLRGEREAIGPLFGTWRAQHCVRFSNSGSLPMLAAMRRASSRVGRAPSCRPA